MKLWSIQKYRFMGPQVTAEILFQPPFHRRHSLSSRGNLSLKGLQIRGPCLLGYKTTRPEAPAEDRSEHNTTNKTKTLSDKSPRSLGI